MAQKALCNTLTLTNAQMTQLLLSMTLQDKATVVKAPQQQEYAQNA